MIQSNLFWDLLELPSLSVAEKTCVSIECQNKKLWYNKQESHFMSMGFCQLRLKTEKTHCATWGRGWMTKASGVGERRKGRGELRRDCHHRVAALFVPTRMQQWYIDIWYITMIYMGKGAGGGPFAGKITWCPWGAPEYVLKQEDSSELTLAFVIMTIIANNDKM